MTKLKEHMLHNKILYRMIAGYTLLCALAILSITTLLYNKFGREFRDEIFQNQESSLQRIASMVGLRAEHVNYLLQEAKRDNEISALFYQNNADEERNALLALAEMRMSVRHLNSIYIYNDYNDLIYCSSESYLPLVSSKDSFEDKGFIEMLQNIDQYSKYTPFLRMISLETPAGQKQNTFVYTYLLYDSYSSGSRKNIVAFNFHLSWMEDALNYFSIGTNEEDHIWIVSRDRQVIYTGTGELIGAKVDERTLPDEIYEKKSGYLLTGDKKNQKMLVFASSGQTGYEDWTFLSWNDYSAMIEPINRMRSLIYFVCFLALLVSTMIIIFLSIHLYAPVRQTMDKIDLLELENEKRQKIDKMRFLRRLFQGNETEDMDQMQTRFDQFGISYLLHSDNRVAVLSVDYLKSFERMYGKEMEQMDACLEELFQEEFGRVFGDILFAKMQDGVWGISIQESPGEEGKTDTTDIRQKLELLFESLNRVLDERWKISISMAVSESGHSLRDIPYLYAEAMDILPYHYLLGYKRILTKEDIGEYGQKKFEYPHEIEKNLISSLFAGNLEASREAYGEFVRQISGFSVEEIKICFMLLAYSLKSASRNAVIEVSSILTEFDQFYTKLYTLETIFEVDQMFLHLMSEITERLQAYAQERHEALIDRIRNYVAEHYNQISLSMSEVADSVEMSAAYLGRLFKQVAGQTFTEYLTKYRLEKACELLDHTEMTVNEISDEVGFTNSSYFYIVFKKNMGCTPTQYRKGGKG